MRTNKHLPLFLTVIAALSFIFPPILVKLLMSEINPIGALTIRFFIAACLFPAIIFFLKREKIKEILYPTKSELGHFAFLAFLLYGSMAIAFVAYYFIPVNKALLIFLMYPAFDSILAWMFLHEKIMKTDIASIALTIVGAYFIFGFKSDNVSIIGYSLSIIGMLLFAAYLVTSRSVGKQYHYYKRTAWLFIYCFFFLCLTFFFSGGIDVIFLLSGKAWILLFFFATVSTLLPYTCLSYSTAKIKSSVISIITELGPVLGIVFATWMFDEPFTNNMIIGSMFIGSAFFLSTIIEWFEEEEKGAKKCIKHFHH